MIFYEDQFPFIDIEASGSTKTNDEEGDLWAPISSNFFEQESPKPTGNVPLNPGPVPGPATTTDRARPIILQSSSSDIGTAPSSSSPNIAPSSASSDVSVQPVQMDSVQPPEQPKLLGHDQR